jgi:hypothetical protein
MLGTCPDFCPSACSKSQQRKSSAGEGDDFRVFLKCSRTLFTNGAQYFIQRGLVGIELVIPDRRSSVLIDDLQGPIGFSFQPIDINFVILSINTVVRDRPDMTMLGSTKVCALNCPKTIPQNNHKKKWAKPTRGRVVTV